MSGEISLWRNWWVGCSIGLLLLLAALSIMMRSGFGLTVLGDVTALLLLGFATGIMLLNAWQTQGQTRAFWALISAGFVLWFLNQAGWTWIVAAVEGVVKPQQVAVVRPGAADGDLQQRLAVSQGPGQGGDE